MSDLVSEFIGERMQEIRTLKTQVYWLQQQVQDRDELIACYEALSNHASSDAAESVARLAAL